jgi:hypothetical protein
VDLKRVHEVDWRTHSRSRIGHSLHCMQRVNVCSYAQSIVGVVEDLLPMTEAMPPEFQMPGEARQRGQVFKISIGESAAMPLDQKVKISACYFNMCDSGAGMFLEITRRIMNYAEPIEGYAR